METLQGILSAHPFFHDLPPQHIETVTGCISNVRFNAGKVIFDEGEEANHFYLIREGKVALRIHSERRGPLTILTLGAGDVLGWSWLFPPYRWKFSARTMRKPARWPRMESVFGKKPNATMTWVTNS